MELKSINSKRYKNYTPLLQKFEHDLPESVKRTIDFFEDNNLWFNLSRNMEARSCRDASHKRQRLGHLGIPLEDELKSFFGKFRNVTGSEQYVILHCRGNQELDIKKAESVLHSPDGLERLTKVELADLFGLDYGVVNPFSLDPLFFVSPIYQVFDKSVLTILKPPYTMMTNAGDLTWAIEFKPSDLIKAISHSIIEDIVDHEASSPLPTRLSKIGILTGNAPDSGIHLWLEINSIIREKLGNKFQGDISLPIMLVESNPDLGLTMELDKRENESREAVKKGIISLCNQGATIICIACNTSQYFNLDIKKICEQTNTKFISLADATIEFIEENKIQEFAFLGINFVTDFDRWSAFKKLKKYNVEFLRPETLDKINELAYRVKQDGITGSGINKLRDLLNHSVKSQNVIIALTELSILLKDQKKKGKSDRNYIDTLELLAQAVAKEYLSEMYPGIDKEQNDD